MWGTQLSSWLLTGVFGAAAVNAQAPSIAVCVAATTDAFSTEVGGFLFDLPGVGDDFLRFADGAWDQRSNGTARLSVYASRGSALDRDFFLALEFTGRIGPGDAGYPPLGSPVLTLSPNAYVPTGSVDPSQYVYYTQVTGTLTGLRAFAGARLLATATGPTQIGLGASNKNTRLGLAANLSLSIVQQPTAGPLTILGPMALRGELLVDTTACFAHVDAQPVASGSAARSFVTIPGLAAAYIASPPGTWTDANDGSATFTATIRRQSNYADAWLLQVTLTGRTLPLAANHPPVGSPVLQLLPAVYASQGGPIDPTEWRYFTQTTGTLQGLLANAGGIVQLSTVGPFQVGLGAAQGNLFFGCSGNLAATITQQPTAGAITITSPLTLQANLSTDCLLPAPQVLTGITQSIPSVSQQRLVYTGIDLGFCELVAIGPHIVGANPRRWFEGHLRVLAHDTVEVALPQGLAATTYPVRLLTRTSISNLLTADVQAPTLPTMRTENDRLIGESQHWVVHQGNVPGFAFCFVVLSPSNVPSFAPGFVDLLIGNQFSDYVLIDVAFHDPVTGVAVVSLTAVPPTLVGLRLYAQGALMNVQVFPLHPSDVWFTDY